MITAIQKYLWQAVCAIAMVVIVILGYQLADEKMGHAKTRVAMAELATSLEAERGEFARYVGEQQVLNKTAADDARTKEQALQAAADKFKGDSYVQIHRLQRERNAALDGLRQRPARPAAASTSANPAAVPTPAGPGADAGWCTGANLYREDAESALGIAYDADELRIKYLELRSIYTKARDQTNTGAVNAK